MSPPHRFSCTRFKKMSIHTDSTTGFNASLYAPVDIDSARVTVQAREDDRALGIFNSMIAAAQNGARGKITAIYIEPVHMAVLVQHNSIIGIHHFHGRTTEADEALAAVCNEFGIWASLSHRLTGVIRNRYFGPTLAISTMQSWTSSVGTTFYMAPRTHSSIAFDIVVINDENTILNVFEISKDGAISLATLHAVSAVHLRTAIDFLNIPAISAKFAAGEWHAYPNWDAFDAYIQGTPDDFHYWQDRAEKLTPETTSEAFWLLTDGTVIVAAKTSYDHYPPPCRPVLHKNIVHRMMPDMKATVERLDPDGSKYGDKNFVFINQFDQLSPDALNTSLPVFHDGKWVPMDSVYPVTETLSIDPYDYVVKRIDNPKDEANHDYQTIDRVVILTATPLEPEYEPWQIIMAVGHETRRQRIYIDIAHNPKNGVHAEAIALMLNVAKVTPTDLFNMRNANHANCTPQPLPSGQSFVSTVAFCGKKWRPASVVSNKIKVLLDNHCLVQWTCKASFRAVSPFVISSSEKSISSLFDFLISSSRRVKGVPGIVPEHYGYTLLNERPTAVIASSLDGMTIPGFPAGTLTFQRAPNFDMTRTNSQFTWHIDIVGLDKDQNYRLGTIAIDKDGKIFFTTSTSNYYPSQNDYPNDDSSNDSGYEPHDTTIHNANIKAAVLAAVRETGCRPARSTMNRLRIRTSDMTEIIAKDNVIPVPRSSLTWAVRPDRYVLYDGIEEIAILDRTTRQFSNVTASRIADTAKAFKATASLLT